MINKQMKEKIIFCFIVLLLFCFCYSTISAQESKSEKYKNVEEKITKNDSWLGVDKFLHFAASAGITGLSYHSYHCQFNNPQKNSIYFSVSLAGAAGIGKECVDKNIRKTGWSWKDIVADGAGIVVGYLLFIKLHK
jgi:uncharacterized protein YfiM (DUF2279 family)